MAFLKKLLIGIGALIVIVCVIGFFLPSEYSVERRILIKANPSEVYPEVVDLKAWQNGGFGLNGIQTW